MTCTFTSSVTGDEAIDIIQAEIDATFDDAQFVKMDPDSRIDAAYARKEFGDKKPSLVDYMLWTAEFVTHSDVIEW